MGTWVRIPPPPPSSAEAYLSQRWIANFPYVWLGVNFGRTSADKSANIYNKVVFYVYALENNLGVSYIGCTTDLKARLIRHNKGYVDSTKNNKLWRLVAYFAFTSKDVAFRFERYLKTGSGKEFIRRHVKCRT